MVEQIYVFQLGDALRDRVLGTLGEYLSHVLPDAATRTGLLEGLLLALQDHEASPDEVSVTVRTSPQRVELELKRGSVRDTLMCWV